MRKFVIVLVLILIVAGLSSWMTVKVVRRFAPTPQPPLVVEKDPYDGWLTVSAGEIISLRLPPNCATDSGAGSMYVACGDTDQTRVHTMTMSSDGQILHIRRGAYKNWPAWDAVMGSMRIKSPLNRSVTISLDE